MSKRPKWWLDALKVFWPLQMLGARLTNLPIIGPVLGFIITPFFRGKNFNVSYIPINLDLKGTQSATLPSEILMELIKRSSYRVTINRCSCRDSEGCKEFPTEDSCMLLGEDTAKIDKRISKHISIDEAIEHVTKKIDLGLVPMIGRVRLDDFFYGVPNRGKMLTVCFCCTCCCSVLGSLKYLPSSVEGSVVKLKGVSVKVDHNKCKQCGKCIENCFKNIITLENNLTVHDDSRCIGCGRCVAVCPEKAVSIHIDDIDEAVKEIMGRIKERVDIE